MIIEFYGFSGVGKSTLAKALRQAISAIGLNTRGSWSLTLPWYRRIDPRALMVLIRVIWHLDAKPLGSASGLRLLRGLYADLIRLATLRRLKLIGVSDQGPFQRLGAMRKHACSSWNHKAADIAIRADSRFRCDVLVVVTASAEVVRQRQLKRDGFAQADVEYQRSMFIQKALLAQLGDMDPAIRPLVICVDSSEPDSATRIVDLIMSASGIVGPSNSGATSVLAPENHNLLELSP